MENNLLSAAAAALGRRVSLARAKSLTAERRRQIALGSALARWAARDGRPAKIATLSDLQKRNDEFWRARREDK